MYIRDLYTHSMLGTKLKILDSESVIPPVSLVGPDPGPYSHGGGEGGGGSAPLEKFEPPLGCAVPFAVTIGIEVYPPPPWNSVSPPLLTIPGYGAGRTRERYII